MKRQQGDLDIHEDYEAIEAAVMETPRGRWFLSEFLRRHQAKETRRLLDALRRLERALELNQQLAPRIMAAFAATSATMHARPGSLPPALPEAVRSMAQEQRALAAILSSLAQDAEHRSEKAEALQEVVAQLNSLARKTEILARGLDDVAVLCGAPHPAAMAEPLVPEDALQWFAAHETFFAEDAHQNAPSVDEDGTAVPPFPSDAVQSAEYSPFDRADHAAGTPTAAVEEPHKDVVKDVIAHEENGSEQKRPFTGTIRATDNTSHEARSALAEQVDGKSIETHAASARGEGHLTIFITPASTKNGGEEEKGKNRSKRSTPRIVISRRSSSEELDIPLIDEVSAGQETS